MQRSYLFLQGPHGPFFARLAGRLSTLGHDVARVGFNAGDRAFWPRRFPYSAFTAGLEEWPDYLATLLDGTNATDLVLYGDTRAIHAQAIPAARARGLRVHVFEEGYLRPYWVTYERGGANGNSPLMAITQAEIDQALPEMPQDRPMPPGSWGAMRAHIFYGALYHFCGLVLNRRYRALAPHRGLSLRREAGLYLKLLLTMVPRWLSRVLATRRVLRGGYPYHLVLLQLAHDASFRDHGPFADMGAFLAEVIAGFASGSPEHHHLVFKAHPLEDGRFPIQTEIMRLARQMGVEARVHFVAGGKLAPLLDPAQSAVTVNSTAAHQALWRGLPVKAFGRAVYTGRGFTSDQALTDFFTSPQPTDINYYSKFRSYLLATNQIPGSFYSTSGRRQLMRRIIDRMLAETDSYDHLKRGKTATGPQLFVLPQAPI